jgi:SAM-dependent MidA family methyltransferase
LIFSNELVDAFAVRRFEKTESGWREIFVHRDETGRTHETLMQAGPLPDSRALNESFQRGQRVEVHDFYRTWLAAWLPRWSHGRMLTIDYGGEIESLYHRRPHGTVRAYLLQQRLEGHEIYQNPGLQDLTADVNFTDLQQWHRNSLETLGLSNFGTFVRRFTEVRNLSDQSLLAPHGAGSAFLVLEQRPRIPAADLPNKVGPV